MFDPTKFYTPAASPIANLKEYHGAVIDGNLPWASLKSKSINGVTMCQHKETKTIVIFDPQFGSTSYYDIDPKVVWSYLQDKITWDDLFKEEGMSWSGGAIEGGDIHGQYKHFIKFCNEGDI